MQRLKIVLVLAVMFCLANAVGLQAQAEHPHEHPKRGKPSALRYALAVLRKQVGIFLGKLIPVTDFLSQGVGNEWIHRPIWESWKHHLLEEFFFINRTKKVDQVRLKGNGSLISIESDHSLQSVSHAPLLEIGKARVVPEIVAPG